jgi:hypothetical protein
VTEDAIIELVESKDTFSAAEVATIMVHIANCVKEGSPAEYFDQAIDKMIGSAPAERDREQECTWQEWYDNNKEA